MVTHAESPYPKVSLREAFGENAAGLRDWQRTIEHRPAQPHDCRISKLWPVDWGSSPRGSGKSFEKFTGR